MGVAQEVLARSFAWAHWVIKWLALLSHLSMVSGGESME